MSSGATIIACPKCRAKNRVRPTSSGVPRCSVCHTSLPWLVDATAESFDAELESAVPVLVDFWAPWCGPCRMVSPLVEKLGRDHAGHLKVVKLNVDEAQVIAARHRVQGIPLLVVFEHGKEVERLVGAVPEGQLRRWLQPHVEPAAGKGAATRSSSSA